MSNSHDFSKKETNIDECLTKGICAINPALSSMHAVLLVYLQELSFYLHRLDKLGANNEIIKEHFIDALSLLTMTSSYSTENFHHLLAKIYEDIFQSKEIYKMLCEKNEITPEYLKSTIKITKIFRIENAIKQGQKAIAQREKSLSENKKKLFELLLYIFKSVCIYLVELQGLGINIHSYYQQLLFAFGGIEAYSMPESEIDEIIKKFVEIDYELMNKIYETRKEHFGEFIKTEVSHSVRPGKAILVAGANIQELDLILKATEGRGIDVYTHGQMITGHTLPKIKAYSHLVGHYGVGPENYRGDFSTFPGAIVLTKLSLLNVNNLYQCKIFTTDKIASTGINIINNYDFEPLIQAALNAVGFKTSTNEENIEVGFVESEFMAKTEAVADMIKTGEIKHVMGIGFANNTLAQKEYFDEFLKLLKEDCFIFSFSYKNGHKNKLYANIDWGFVVVYKSLRILAEGIGVEKLNPIVMFARCEPHTIPNLFMMNYLGMKRMFLDDCSPMLINPALVNFIKQKLGINSYSTPREDFRKLFGKEP